MNKETNRGRFGGPWLIVDQYDQPVESWGIQENAERACSLLNEHDKSGLKYSVKWVSMKEIREIQDEVN